MKKWIISIIVIILIGSGATWYVKKGKADQANPTTIIPTATVKKGNIQSKVSGSGSLLPTIDEDIKPDASHTVYDIYVSVGDKVKKGQAILIYNNGTKLYAPASGTITAINVYNNSRVSAGQAVAHIINYSDLNTTVQVDELDVPSVKIGQPVNIVVNAFPDKTYTGKVTDIAKEGSVSNGVSTFDVTVHLTSSKGLKAGMTTTADIITDQKNNVLYVPVEAVHKMRNETFVLVKDQSTVIGQTAGNNQNNNNKNQQGKQKSQYSGRSNLANGASAKRVTVTTGIHNDSYIEITSGLTEGQVVELPPIVQNSGQSGNQQVDRAMFGGGFGRGGGNFRGNFGGGGNSRGGGSNRGTQRGGN